MPSRHCEPPGCVRKDNPLLDVGWQPSGWPRTNCGSVSTKVPLHTAAATSSMHRTSGPRPRAARERCISQSDPRQRAKCMSRPKRKYDEAVESVVDHDSWNYSLPKLPRESKISLGDIRNVLPFDGVRNPSARSSISHKVHFPYRTPANDWKPKIGIAESAAEMAAGLEALMAPNIYDVAFQPLTVEYRDEDGRVRSYTHDLLITLLDGYRRLLFVRNEESLTKPRTQRQIESIVAATPPHVANDMIVVNANDYTRQRRENLIRMYHFVFHPDPEADEALLETAVSLKSFYYMKDLFPHAAVSQPRGFAACHRLIAKGALRADLDHVLWEYSRVEVAE